MGYNARNDEIRDNITRMRRGWTHAEPSRIDCGTRSAFFGGFFLVAFASFTDSGVSVLIK